MSEQEYARFGDMKMFMHHIYEFKKGVRSLVLCTMCRTCASIVAERLRGQQIGYMIQEVSEKKVNLYFGKQECLDAVKTFITQASEPAVARGGLHAGRDARLRHIDAVPEVLRAEKHAASHRIASLIFMPSVLSFTESGSSREARSGLAPYGRTPSRTTQK